MGQSNGVADFLCTEVVIEGFDSLLLHHIHLLPKIRKVMKINSDWFDSENNMYKCPYCNLLFTKKGISTHIIRNHTTDNNFKNSGTLGLKFKISKECLDLLAEKRLKAKNLKNFNVNCFICNNVFIVTEPNEKFPLKNKYFCSKKCEHTRIHSDETKNKISTSLIKRNKNPDLFKRKKNFCKNCSKEINIRIKFCTKKCMNSYRTKNYDDLKLYRIYSQFKFNLSDYPDKFDFDLIKKFGWYKPSNKGNNLNGISRDHIISVKYGFLNNVPTSIISHPANCQLMQHTKNSSKNMKCDMSIDELLKKIKEWNKSKKEELIMSSLNAQ